MHVRTHRSNAARPPPHPAGKAGNAGVRLAPLAQGPLHAHFTEPPPDTFVSKRIKTSTIKQLLAMDDSQHERWVQGRLLGR